MIPYSTVLNYSDSKMSASVLMKAAIYESFGGPIRIRQVPIPLVPDDGVLLQVQATGVCRSDWHGWKGHDGDVHAHGLPFCPGHELSGVVVKVGRNTHKFDAGDRVAVPFILSCGSCRFCREGRATICARQQQPGFTQWGSFAEYVAIPRADRNVRHLPADVSFVQAAALGCRFTTAYRAVLQQGKLGDMILRKNNNKQNQQTSTTTTTSVAVFGCGGLGLSCIMIAASKRSSECNIEIIAVDVSSKALEKARQVGATRVVQVGRESSPQEIAKEVARQCTLSSNDDDDQQQQQVGADLTLDAAGFASTSEAAVYATRPGGRMVQVGLPHDRIPEIPMNVVAGRELELVGSHGFDAQDLPDLLQLISSSSSNKPQQMATTTTTMDPCQLVEQEVSLEEGCRILENMDKQSPLGIVMITNFGEDDGSSHSKNPFSRL
jgi:alcohol dehydrogenase